MGSSGPLFHFPPATFWQIPQWIENGTNEPTATLPICLFIPRLTGLFLHLFSIVRPLHLGWLNDFHFPSPSGLRGKRRIGRRVGIGYAHPVRMMRKLVTDEWKRTARHQSAISTRAEKLHATANVGASNFPIALLFC